MNVTLLRIPTIIDASASTAPTCPPIGLAYVKSVVKKFTENITVVDSVGNYPHTRTVRSDQNSIKLLGQTTEEITNLLPENTDIILVSCMFSQDWIYGMEIIKSAKLKCPQALIVAGGEHITALPEYSMTSAPEIDVCVLGEGEKTLELILSELKETGEFSSDQPGTCIRHKESGIIRNENQSRLKALDSLQWPDWEGFPLENYFKDGHGFGVNLSGRNMPIVASRGCPYQCTFCSNPNMWTTAWNVREPEDVVAEMKLYIDKYQITNFDFYDLTAIVQKKWIVKFCHLLIESRWDITWQLPSGTRSEAIDKEVAALLYQSGCRNLSYAPESGSDEILKRIKKKISLDKMLSSMRECNSEGLSIKVNIICGFPDEQWKHLRETLKFIVKVAWVGCDDLSINQFSPYPGSELFQELIEKGKLKLDEHYFEALSYYSSMTNAESYSDFLSNRDIITYKLTGTALFYVVSFARRPQRFFRTIVNVYRRQETTRLEKTLISYAGRLKRES